MEFSDMNHKRKTVDTVPMMLVPFESSERTEDSKGNLQTPRQLKRNESNFSKASKTTGTGKKKKKSKKGNAAAQKSLKF